MVKTTTTTKLTSQKVTHKIVLNLIEKLLNDCLAENKINSKIIKTPAKNYQCSPMVVDLMPNFYFIPELNNYLVHNQKTGAVLSKKN